MFTMARTTVMRWNAKIITSKNVLSVMSLEEETPCETEIVLAIGDPGGYSPCPELRGRPPGPPLPSPRCGFPRPRLRWRMGNHLSAMLVCLLCPVVLVCTGTVVHAITVKKAAKASVACDLNAAIALG